MDKGSLYHQKIGKSNPHNPPITKGNNLPPPDQ